MDKLQVKQSLQHKLQVKQSLQHKGKQRYCVWEYT